MVSPPVVAVAGASGHLGLHIASAIHAARVGGTIKDLIILSRKGSNQPAEISDWQKNGTITVRTYSEDSTVKELREPLLDVDVLVNTIGSAGYKFRDKLLQAIPGSNVKLYLPSEFGVDHYGHDFPHPEWDHKKHHMEIARASVPDLQICRVFAGLFLEDSIGPWFGFDVKNSTYECLGSRNTPVTFTALDDVGKAVSQVLQMPFGQVPAQLHLAGDTKSVAQIASIMGEQSGTNIDIVEKEIATYKDKELKNPRPDPSGCLRFLMGEGKINHTVEAMGNDDNLVNPQESRWKWKTLQDEAEATGGRPWFNAEWQ